MKRTVLLLMLGGLLGCAQVREISGGEKDTAGPILLSADPPAYTTGFNGRRIVLQFNERIKVGSLRDQFLVSPPLQEMPEVMVQGGTTVVIELDEPLLPATTYSFYLGDAIKDLTEGNPAADLSYVISTGTYIDSGSVAGRVIEAASGAPATGVHVFLYAPDDTGSFRGGRPLYASRTDENGAFSLRNLRAGDHRLLALRDQNGNMRFDLPNEEVAFNSGTVRANSDTITHLLRLFREAPEQQQLMDQRVEADRDWLFVLAKPSQGLALRDLDRTGGTLHWSVEPNTTADTIRLWPNDTTAINGHAFELTDGGVVLDTVRYRVRDKMPFDLSVALATTGDTLALRAGRPVSRVDTTLIKVLQDSIPLAYTIHPDTVNRRLVRLVAQRRNRGTTRLQLLPKALTDLYGGHNDTVFFKAEHPGPEELGEVSMVLRSQPQGPEGRLLIRLLNARGVKAYEQAMAGPGMVRFAEITPGSYRIELVEDLNGNGKWDTGDLDAARQPERTWSFPGTVMARAGWTVEETWEVTGP